jgi:DNA-binding PadR family transcriptional regulator
MVMTPPAATIDQAATGQRFSTTRSRAVRRGWSVNIYLDRICCHGLTQRLARTLLARFASKAERMVRRPDSSPQTLAVLAALHADPSVWRHGYELAKQTGLRSGSLYPILMRLADRGYLETCWEQGQPQGRPRRHLYRLTAAGAARAAEAQPVPGSVPRPAASRRRLAAEGA